MKNKLYVVLLDDELQALRALSKAIKQLDFKIEICGQFTDPIEAILYIKNNPIDIFFIDVSMPLMDGFEVLRRIGDFSAFKTVFVAASSEYAVEAFKYHVFDYLLKPIGSTKLNQCLLDYRLTMHNVKKENKIILQSSNKIYFVNYEDVIYLKSDNSYTKLMLADKSILSSKPISYFTKVLDSSIFVRCHNSYLVNKSQIREYRKKSKSLLLSNQEE
ncbi:MAG: LytR/AlgR family response regulator transcription factor, partial [Chitinophagales bacterium]